MRKLILVLLTIIVAFIVYINVNAETDEIIIPEAAIRVRVIANSNNIHDQSIKLKVKELIETTLSPMLINVDNLEEARTIIKENLSQLETDIKVLFNNNDYNKPILINFGDNFFPSKDYKGIHYEEGKYESLVITIGEGKGDNWWCVLFPPLCLLEAEENNTTDIEYQLFVLKMLEKIFS